MGGIARIFRRPSRTQKRIANNLGVIGKPSAQNILPCRDPQLDLYESYYENTQYDHLTPWEDAVDPKTQTFIPIRQRRPRIRVPMARLLASRLTSMMIGGGGFPMPTMKEFPDEQAFFRAVVNGSQLKARLLEPVRRMLNSGSVFVRFHLNEGAIKMEWFSSKHCYPKFGPDGQLSEIEIKYVFLDRNEVDEETGDFKLKWFRMILGNEQETLFESVEYNPDAPDEEPEWTVKASVEHGLGFVQGTWFRTCEQRSSPDGYGIVADIMDFIDELCYSVSQSSQAVGYNQDPQLTVKGLDANEVEDLIRSATKSWLLGRQGEANFLESNLTGVEKAMEMRDKVKNMVQDFARVILMDPEKIVGSAQSAKSMEVLHGPMVEFVKELRLLIDPQIKELITKMAVAILLANRQGIAVPMEIPPGWAPQSIGFENKWGKIFEDTMEDKQKEANWLNTLVSGNIISRKTATRYAAENYPELGIEDVEVELAEIAAQPVINPFGSF
jgi:hypothetical protein